MTTATILPNGRKTYLDQNGIPLAGGLVYFYSPNTTSLKTTWLDAGELVANTNPVILDAAGTAVVYGSGVYREYVTDFLGNVISDSLTADTLGAAAAISDALKAVTSASTTAQALIALGAPATFTNIADLKANTEIQPPIIFVAGYYTAGDEGAGIFTLASTDTTSADNGGTIIVDAAGHRWYRETNGQPYNLYWFGARPDGQDRTAQITACLRAATSRNIAVYHPPGTWQVSTLPLLSGLSWHGAGDRISILQTNQFTGDVMTFNAWLDISDCGFASTVQRSSGAMINLNCDGIIQRVRFDMYCHAIMATGNVGTIRDCGFTNPTQATGIGLIVNGYAGGLVVDNLLFYVPPFTPAAGINVQSCGAMQISNCNVICQGTNLLINPGAGQTVASIWATNSFFDTAQVNGMAVSATGNVVRCHFDGCWFCSASNDGVTMGGLGTGQVTAMSFVDCTMIVNKVHGISVNAGCSDIRITGGQYQGNQGDGIAIANTNGVTVTSVIAGSSPALGGNFGRGITIAGTTDNYIVSLNRTSGNGGVGILDGGQGTTKFVGNNL